MYYVYNMCLSVRDIQELAQRIIIAHGVWGLIRHGLVPSQDASPG